MVFSKLPKKAKIKKTTYPISYKKSLKDCHGISFHYRPRIDISADNSKEDIESTVIHEIIHAIDCRYDLGLSEKKVLLLEAAIYGLFKDNGWKISIK